MASASVLGVFGGGGMSVFTVIAIILGVILTLGLGWYYLRGNQVQKHKLKSMLPGMQPTHQIDTTILAKQGEGGFIFQSDKAARYKEDDKEYYHLLKADQEVPAPDYEFVGTSSTGGSHAVFFRHGHDQFQPVRPDFQKEVEEDRFTGDNVNMREWFAAGLKEDNAYWQEDDVEWWQSDFAKWSAIGSVLFLILLGSGWYLTQMNEAVASTLKNLPNNAGGAGILLAWKLRRR